MKLEEKTGGVQISSVKFWDNTVLNLGESSILLVTGPNNCGKSQLLRELSLSFRGSQVSKSVEYKITGEIGEIVRGLIEEMYDIERPEIVEKLVSFWSGDFDDFLDKTLEYNRSFAEQLSSYILKYVATFNRTGGVDFDHDGHSDNNFIFKAIHESSKLEARIYDIIRSTFGTGMLINRDSFLDRSLKFIDKDAVDRRQDRGEKSFARWLEKEPSLDQQGDGVKAFCTVLLSILTQIKPLIIIDEPEAFLHPPQARRLARYIATETPAKTQVVIATHSNDIVQGLLDYADERVSVLRLVKKNIDKETINIVSQLNSKDISELWKDPLLKTSDTLTSLFHDMAIIVEGDSDARFFKAMLDAIYRDNAGYLPDYRFFHCGGKDRIAKIASSLKSAGVPVMCIVDIDILDNKQKFLDLYSIFGGDPNDITAYVDYIHRFVSEKKSPITSSDAKNKIDDLFQNFDPKQPIPASKIPELNDIIQNFSSWRYVKSNGETFFSGGDPYNHFVKVCTKAQEIGIIINRYGELENLCKTITPRKSEWLSLVLQKELSGDEDLKSARDFTENLVRISKMILA